MASSTISLVGSAADFLTAPDEILGGELSELGELNLAILKEEAQLMLLLSVSGVSLGSGALFVDEARVLDKAGDEEDRDDEKEPRFQPELEASFLVSQCFEAFH